MKVYVAFTEALAEDIRQQRTSVGHHHRPCSRKGFKIFLSSSLSADCHSENVYNLETLDAICEINWSVNNVLRPSWQSSQVWLTRLIPFHSHTHIISTHLFSLSLLVWELVPRIHELVMVDHWAAQTKAEVKSSHVSLDPPASCKERFHCRGDTEQMGSST